MFSSVPVLGDDQEQIALTLFLRRPKPSETDVGYEDDIANLLSLKDSDVVGYLEHHLVGVCEIFQMDPHQSWVQIPEMSGDLKIVQITELRTDLLDAETADDEDAEEPDEELPQTD